MDHGGTVTRGGIVYKCVDGKLCWDTATKCTCKDSPIVTRVQPTRDVALVGPTRATAGQP